MRVGLNYMRALRHPCLVSDLQTRDVYPHGPARAILSQPALERLRPSGEGHLVIHSHKERRYRCKRCGRTFTETKDTAFYRMHKPRWLVLAVMTLLSYGCPVQAIVVAFGIDERTVARWQRESGSLNAGGSTSIS
jgi:hypothetical protein